MQLVMNSILMHPALSQASAGVSGMRFLHPYVSCPYYYYNPTNAAHIRLVPARVAKVSTKPMVQGYNDHMAVLLIRNPTARQQRQTVRNRTMRANASGLCDLQFVLPVGSPDPPPSSASRTIACFVQTNVSLSGPCSGLRP